MALATSSCCQAPLEGRLAKSFHGCQSLGWRQNELRLVAASSTLRVPLKTRTKKPLVVEATFKDFLKSFVRFAYNTPLKFFLKELDHELDVAEERLKEGAKLIKEATHTVEKIAEAADKAAEDVGELVDKIEASAEKVYNEIEEVLDEVELEKAAVKELKEKVEKSEQAAVKELENKIEQAEVQAKTE